MSYNLQPTPPPARMPYRVPHRINKYILLLFLAAPFMHVPQMGRTIPQRQYALGGSTKTTAAGSCVSTKGIRAHRDSRPMDAVPTKVVKQWDVVASDSSFQTPLLIILARPVSRRNRNTLHLILIHSIVSAAPIS